ncbi:hypothetical protein GCM10022237_07700 [Nocardioides ginsengisoli]
MIPPVDAASTYGASARWESRQTTAATTTATTSTAAGSAAPRRRREVRGADDEDAEGVVRVAMVGS